MQSLLQEAAKAFTLAAQAIDQDPEMISPTNALLSALAQSTFALAQEQHTANLIAWTNAGNGNQDLRREIQKRLEL